MRGKQEESMIWFDIAVILLLTLRMVLFGPMLPRLLDPENDSSSLAGNKGEEESLLDADGDEGESLQLSEIGTATPGVLQLHIHVMPDLKGPR
jgi:hypothetical protein